MIKILGSCLLIIGFGTIGIIIGKNYSLRPMQIRYLQNALRMLETEILYGLTPLPRALERIAKHTNYPINKLCFNTAFYLVNNQGITAGEAWEEALKQLKNESALLPEDLDALLNFGKSLGDSDKDEQEKNLQLVQAHLKTLEYKAEKLKEKNQKLCQYFGFSLGIILVLIFI